ncbi:MAG: integrase [archaeon]
MPINGIIPNTTVNMYNPRNLIGNKAQIYPISYDGKQAFLVVVNHESLNSETGNPLENRIKSLENQIEEFRNLILRKQPSIIQSENRDGPVEIRTRDLRRVKNKNLVSCDMILPNTHLDLQSIQEEEKVCSQEKLNDYWLKHKQSFKEWLDYKGLGERTKKDYISSLTKFFENYSLSSPKELRQVLLKDKSQRGLRNLFNYLEEEDIENPCGYDLDKWRRLVKFKKSGACEVYITDKELHEAYEQCPEDYKTVFKLLVCSGSRLSQLHKMLENFDEKNVIIDGDIAHYPTSEFSSGNKKTFQIFFPTSYLDEIKSSSNLPHYDSLRDNLKIGRVGARSIRKWHLNAMIEEGVTESVAEFIQGRAATTVGSAHYLNKVKQAKTEYHRIVHRFLF